MLGGTAASWKERDYASCSEKARRIANAPLQSAKFAMWIRKQVEIMVTATRLPHLNTVAEELAETETVRMARLPSRTLPACVKMASIRTLSRIE